MPHANSDDSNGASGQGLGSELWRHAAPESTHMWKFLQTVNKEKDLQLKDYDDLYDWSVDQTAEFWDAVWKFTGIRASAPYDEVGGSLRSSLRGAFVNTYQVLPKDAPMFPRPNFFRGAKLNFAENLLYPPQAPSAYSPAIIAATETDREIVTWAQLREKVRMCQSGMLALDIKPGDRIAGYVANHTNALVAMLAATSLGAIWTAISPDTGVTAVLDRLTQIEPVILFADNASMYNGKTHPTMPKVQDIGSSLPSLRALVIFPTVPSVSVQIDTASLAGIATSYDSFIKKDTAPRDITFTQLPPDHPVYILYSSGTTGAPKCIVHGAIGTLIQHKKEHILHCDILPGDRLFYFTTCTWMMWHWLVSGLASGATLVLYDGSPFRYVSDDKSVADDLAMARLIDELSITHFGTSAKYLSVLEQKSVMPKEQSVSLNTLKAIYSTGSPLAPSTFQYVYRAFGSVNLGSITGGTGKHCPRPNTCSKAYLSQISSPSSEPPAP
jgi:acetoacetyl-CoA synthetase